MDPKSQHLQNIRLLTPNDSTNPLLEDLPFTQLPQDPVKGGLTVLGFQQMVH
jgi:hypothetical protein